MTGERVDLRGAAVTPLMTSVQVDPCGRRPDRTGSAAEVRAELAAMPGALLPYLTQLVK